MENYKIDLTQSQAIILSAIAHNRLAQIEQIINNRKLFIDEINSLRINGYIHLSNTLAIPEGHVDETLANFVHYSVHMPPAIKFDDRFSLIEKIALSVILLHQGGWCENPCKKISDAIGIKCNRVALFNLLIELQHKEFISLANTASPDKQPKLGFCAARVLEPNLNIRPCNYILPLDSYDRIYKLPIAHYCLSSNGTIDLMPEPRKFTFPMHTLPVYRLKNSAKYHAAAQARYNVAAEDSLAKQHKYVDAQLATDFSNPDFSIPDEVLDIPMHNGYSDKYRGDWYNDEILDTPMHNSGDWNNDLNDIQYLHREIFLKNQIIEHLISK